MERSEDISKITVKYLIELRNSCWKELFEKEGITKEDFLKLRDTTLIEEKYFKEFKEINNAVSSYIGDKWVEEK